MSLEAMLTRRTARGWGVGYRDAAWSPPGRVDGRRLAPFTAVRLLFKRGAAASLDQRAGGSETRAMATRQRADIQDGRAQGAAADASGTVWDVEGDDRPDRRGALEDVRTRLLARAVGDHALPHELALRVQALTSELAQLAR